VVCISSDCIVDISCAIARSVKSVDIDGESPSYSKFVIAWLPVVNKFNMSIFVAFWDIADIVSGV